MHGLEARVTFSIMRYVVVVLLLWISVARAQSTQPTSKITPDLITDHSAASAMFGPASVQWGYMCNIAAHYREQVYAINFTRPSDTHWDTPAPNDAPIAFWHRLGSGQWKSTQVDPPQRTYQTPTLLLSPDGSANIFCVDPGDKTIYWFHSPDPSNKSFKMDFFRTATPAAHLSGAIDNKGRALLVYWGSAAQGYATATLCYTVLDTKTGRRLSGTIEHAGPPFSFNTVYFDNTGGHVLTVRNELEIFADQSTRNHYCNLRYYHSPDPAAGAPWTGTQIFKDDKANIEPLALLVDPAHRIHVLYNYASDQGGSVASARLIYAASRHPIVPDEHPEFMQTQIKTGGYAGRLFQTPGGRIHILAYTSDSKLEYAEVLSPTDGQISPWITYDVGLPIHRIFPITQASGSPLANYIDATLFIQPFAKQKHNMYYFRLPIGAGATP